MLNSLFLAVILIILLFLYWRFYFLRDPRRVAPENSKAIISPADGKLVRIIKIKGMDKGKLGIRKGLFGKITTFTKDVPNAHYLIVICMNVFHVHYQRVPIDGVVKKVKHRNGKFLNAVFKANNMTATLENENNETVIKGKITIKVIQIAGFLARRIFCYLKENQKVKKGQHLGLINLGSQVCLITPKIDLKIKEGQNMYAGKTIIGEMK